MARDRHTRPAPKPTTITEVARRYHAAAVALAQTLGVPLSEVLAQHRESVTAVFIECGRCELRLSASVKLPPLAAQGDGQTGAPDAAPEAGSEFLGNVPKNLGGRPVQPDSEDTIADAPGFQTGPEPYGSWPHLVKRGGLGVWHHVRVQRRGGKTASFLRGSFSMSHIKVLMLPTSPNVAKSPV